MSEKRWRMRSEQLAKTGYKYAPIWRRLRCIEEIAYQDESRHIIEMKAAIMKLKHLCIPANSGSVGSKGSPAAHPSRHPRDYNVRHRSVQGARRWKITTPLR